MPLRWPKRGVSHSCVSGATWYACDFGPKANRYCTSDPCSGGGPEKNTRPVPFQAHLDGEHVLERREQKSTNPITSISTRQTATTTKTTIQSDVVTTTSVSSTTARSASSSISNTSSLSTSAISLASPSTTAAAAPSHRPNIAVIAGAAGGGLVVAIFIGVVIFFWLHTRKSRRQHHRSLEHRLSDTSSPGEMTKKPLVRHSIVAQASPVQTYPQHTTTHTPTASTGSLLRTYPHGATSHSNISPTAWPLRTTSHSYTSSTTTTADADPYTYRHYSAEHFRLPESQASPFNAWKTSHHPTPEDLSRKSIGTFELDNPISPEDYSRAMSRKSSLATPPAMSRRSSLAPTMSRKSSLASVSFPVPDVPTIPTPAPVAGAWNTHRRSSSSGVL